MTYSCFKPYFPLLLLNVLFLHIDCMSISAYTSERQRIMKSEESDMFGSSLVLNKQEGLISDLLIKAKRAEIEDSRVNGTVFPPAINFFESKKLIDSSKVFQIIKRMPKGGALHTHGSAITSLDWLVKNVTYRANCYMCHDNQGHLQMHFYDTPPQPSYCQWESVQHVRERSGNAQLFDQQLIKNISIIVDDPHSTYVTVNDVWRRFGLYFKIVNGLYRYTPIFKDYLQQALREFEEDNVQYIEIRATLSPLYELDGSKHDQEHKLLTYRDTVNDYMAAHPDFIGCKLIQSGIRFFKRDDILDDIKSYIKYQQKYSDIIRGFDLIGQEGPGKPLSYYLDDLLYPSTLDPPVSVPYFFHAGETDWEGSQVDLNLVDAVLLNTSRIGHGFALYKHPEVMKMIKKKDIAIEVNPISNQVLKLVEDLRNHGAITLFANDYPLVVSSDDPAAWGALPLSHDFYMTYMAMTREDAGLEVLKQLAINSIQYSAMTSSEKMEAMKKWERKWNEFIMEILRQHSHDGQLIG
ncbi:adenosine deaminase AGSA-like [Haliotis cracherodii]|uniref:adenosine deaminase AGSA-like n=1 Tax=Haliotis cracherodii TaxID=6455 RepID=UPI0039EC9DB3